MSLHTEVELTCDGGATQFGCAVWHSIFASTGEEARNQATRDGWQTNAPGGLDYCPEHRKTTPRGTAK